MLTVGMAIFDDFPGVWSTIGALRVLNQFGGEIVVVDQNPNSIDGRDARDAAAKWRCKYVPMPENRGTSPPRNRVFDEASSPWVLCIDPHILIDRRGLASLLEYLAANPTSDDLLSGPMVSELTGHQFTHFRDEWGPDQMWGTWGTAWVRRVGCGPVFDVGADAAGQAVFRTVEMDPQPIEAAVLGFSAPIPFAGHQSHLAQMGFVPYPESFGPYAGPPEPLPIPGMGLGLFCARRESWLRFPDDARGFGGEEMTIHELYRERGRLALCLPLLKWYHRFRNPKTAPPYGNVTLESKARNYVLGINRLTVGRDKQLARAAAALRPKIPLYWDRVVASGGEAPPEQPCQTCGSENEMPWHSMSADDLLNWVRHQKRDLNEHVDRLRIWLAGCESVSLVVKRREWDVIALSLGAKVRSYNSEPAHSLATRLGNLYGDQYARSNQWPREIEPCDALVIDTVHHANQLTTELAAYAPQVAKRIVIRSTGAFGEFAETGPNEPKQPGLLPALRLWLRNNPEWMVVRHTNEQYGMTLISREESHRKPLPGLLQQAWNYAKAEAVHLAAGAKRAATEVYNLRMDTCALCPMRSNDRCSKCGCFIAEKAAMATSECPFGYWAQAEATGAPVVPPLGE